MESLAAVQSARKKFALGPKPGPKIRSGVMAPVAQDESEATNTIDLDNQSDVRMIDLDD